MEFIADIQDSTLGGNLTNIGLTLGQNDGIYSTPPPEQDIN